MGEDHGEDWFRIFREYVVMISGLQAARIKQQGYNNGKMDFFRCVNTFRTGVF